MAPKRAKAKGKKPASKAKAGISSPQQAADGDKFDQMDRNALNKECTKRNIKCTGTNDRKRQQIRNHDSKNGVPATNTSKTTGPASDKNGDKFDKMGRDALNIECEQRSIKRFGTNEHKRTQIRAYDVANGGPPSTTTPSAAAPGGTPTRSASSKVAKKNQDGGAKAPKIAKALRFDFDDMKMQELRAECLKRGIKSSRRKDETIQRLQDDDQQNGRTSQDDDDDGKDDGKDGGQADPNATPTDGLRDSSVDNSKIGQKEISKDMTKDDPNDKSKDKAKDDSKDDPNDKPKDNAKDDPNDKPKEKVKDGRTDKSKDKEKDNSNEKLTDKPKVDSNDKPEDKAKIDSTEKWKDKAKIDSHGDNKGNNKRASNINLDGSSKPKSKAARANTSAANEEDRQTALSRQPRITVGPLQNIPAVEMLQHDNVGRGTCIWRAFARSFYVRDDQWELVRRLTREWFKLAASRANFNLGMPEATSRYGLYRSLNLQSTDRADLVQTGRGSPTTHLSDGNLASQVNVDDEWGAGELLQVLADAFDVEIFAFANQQDNSWSVQTRGRFGSRQIFLANYGAMAQGGGHWTALEPVSNSAGPITGHIRNVLEDPTFLYARSPLYDDTRRPLPLSRTQAPPVPDYSSRRIRVPMELANEVEVDGPVFEEEEDETLLMNEEEEDEEEEEEEAEEETDVAPTGSSGAGGKDDDDNAGSSVLAQGNDTTAGGNRYDSSGVDTRSPNPKQTAPSKSPERPNKESPRTSPPRKRKSEESHACSGPKSRRLPPLSPVYMPSSPQPPSPNFVPSSPRRSPPVYKPFSPRFSPPQRKPTTPRTSPQPGTRSSVSPRAPATKADILNLIDNTPNLPWTSRRNAPRPPAVQDEDLASPKTPPRPSFTKHFTQSPEQMSKARSRMPSPPSPRAPRYDFPGRYRSPNGQRSSTDSSKSPPARFTSAPQSPSHEVGSSAPPQNLANQRKSRFSSLESPPSPTTASQRNTFGSPLTLSSYELRSPTPSQNLASQRKSRVSLLGSPPSPTTASQRNTFGSPSTLSSYELRSPTPSQNPASQRKSRFGSPGSPPSPTMPLRASRCQRRSPSTSSSIILPSTEAPDPAPQPNQRAGLRFTPELEEEDEAGLFFDAEEEDQYSEDEAEDAEGQDQESESGSGVWE